MPAILTAASQRLNASTAGLTGYQPSHLISEPTTTHASATEILDTVPSEFGGLGHIFGGGGGEWTSGLPAPVPTGLVSPSGVPGPLGGIKADAARGWNATKAAVTTGVTLQGEPMAPATPTPGLFTLQGEPLKRAAAAIPTPKPITTYVNNGLVAVRRAFGFRP